MVLCPAYVRHLRVAVRPSGHRTYGPRSSGSQSLRFEHQNHAVPRLHCVATTTEAENGHNAFAVVNRIGSFSRSHNGARNPYPVTSRGWPKACAAMFCLTRDYQPPDILLNQPTITRWLNRGAKQSAWHSSGAEMPRCSCPVLEQRNSIVRLLQTSRHSAGGSVFLTAGSSY